MNIQTENQTPHTLQIYDGELHQLQTLLKQLVELVTFQLDQTLQALHEGDIIKAENVILRDRQVNQYELEIDAEVLIVIARQAPVANDLRTIIATSKIAVELEKIGDQIVEVAKFGLLMFSSKTNIPNPRLMLDMLKMGDSLKVMLNNLSMLVENHDAEVAYNLLAYDKESEQALEDGIKHQLNFIIRDSRMISLGLNIMQMMKSLEHCLECCRNIAEYMILMIKGIDVRHVKIQADLKLS